MEMESIKTFRANLPLTSMREIQPTLTNCIFTGVSDSPLVPPHLVKSSTSSPFHNLHTITTQPPQLHTTSPWPFESDEDFYFIRQT